MTPATVGPTKVPHEYAKTKRPKACDMAPALPKSRGCWVFRSAAAVVRSERQAGRAQTRPKPVERFQFLYFVMVMGILGMYGV